MTQNLWDVIKNSSKRKVYSNSISPQEKKLSNKQSTLTNKATREKGTTTISKKVWRGRWERGSGLGTHVHPWQIHVNVWQNQYSIVK